ncbi:hypothetical protein I6L27_19675 (plasmid) [Acinetobacter pittii]|uniref:hypothetical protein n=1 Tax=Acinetobacter pittii TaxID=48296 RepID=UPI001C2512B2|nr:hypothetical protein [Acinetobacter pittii]QXA10016.1 hypothetical protein I6L27_19675 [Acinetobacter pittii]
MSNNTEVDNSTNKDETELSAHISLLRQSIEEMKKNPAYIREAFFISLLDAYDVVDETLKKRIIGLNSRLLNLQKTCKNIENLDKDLENRLLESIDNKLKLVVLNFEKKLERIGNPIDNTSENIKNMGQTMGRLNKTLVSNLEENNALNMQIKKNISSVVGLTKFLPMLLISNLALIAFLIFDKFF